MTGPRPNCAHASGASSSRPSRDKRVEKAREIGAVCGRQRDRSPAIARASSPRNAPSRANAHATKARIACATREHARMVRPARFAPFEPARAQRDRLVEPSPRRAARSRRGDRRGSDPAYQGRLGSSGQPCSAARRSARSSAPRRDRRARRARAARGARADHRREAAPRARRAAALRRRNRARRVDRPRSRAPRATPAGTPRPCPPQTLRAARASLRGRSARRSDFSSSYGRAQPGALAMISRSSAKSRVLLELREARLRMLGIGGEHVVGQLLAQRELEQAQRRVRETLRQATRRSGRASDRRRSSRRNERHRLARDGVDRERPTSRASRRRLRRASSLDDVQRSTPAARRRQRPRARLLDERRADHAHDREDLVGGHDVGLAQRARRARARDVHAPST